MTDEHKTFDCMERRGAEMLRQRLIAFTREQKIAYWKERDQELLDRQRRFREARGNA